LPPPQQRTPRLQHEAKAEVVKLTTPALLDTAAQ